MRLIDAPPYARNVSIRRILSHRAFARKWRLEALNAVETKELPRPDLIVTSLPPLATHETARALRDAFACRLVVDIQDAWPEAFEGLLPFPSPLRRLLARLFFGSARAVARRAYLTADCLTAVGREYLETARSYGADAPMAVFRLGIADIVEDAAPVADGPLRLVYGGNMGASGCVAWNFTKKGVLVIDNEDEDYEEDEVMMDALDAGAADFEAEETVFTIYTEPDDFNAVADTLGKKYTFASAQIEQVPNEYKKLESEEDLTMMEKLIDAFEDDDDVQNVWHNWDQD